MVVARTATMLAILLCATVTACGGGSRSGPTATPDRGAAPETVATGLDVPWGVAFLPDGSALVSERETGRILRVDAHGGGKRVVTRLPHVDTTGTAEGGLLGLAVSPRYRRDRWVYAYMTTRTDNRIVRFRLGGPVHPILTGLRRGSIHDGGRIAFGPDGKLYAGVDETGDAELAQDRDSLNGKILRMNPDGSVPSGNPFGTLVWSYGHRNVQGFDWDAQGRMWADEFGQSRFDEVNLIRPGGNYGWPQVEGTGGDGRFVAPLVTWPTDEASPSGAAIVGSTMYLGALQGQDVLRVALHGTSARKLPPILRDRYGRIRTVAAAPDGSLLITTSNRDGRGSPHLGDDRMLRLPPDALR